MALLVAVSAAGQAFRLPEIPSGLESPGERATFLSLHYWDHFDFGDEGLIDNMEVSEQAFVDFLSVMPMSEKPEEAMETFVGKAASGKGMLGYFIGLADKYLYEPASPMRDDGLYVMFLQVLVGNRNVPKAEKAGPRWRLERMMMNSVGRKARDFEYETDGGMKMKLSKTKGEYVLVYFHDPECRDCRRMKDALDKSEIIVSMVGSGRMKIIPVSIDDEDKMLYFNELYDLRSFPSLYLLDVRRRVLLKNASVAEVEEAMPVPF